MGVDINDGAPLRTPYHEIERQHRARRELQERKEKLMKLKQEKSSIGVVAGQHDTLYFRFTAEESKAIFDSVLAGYEQRQKDIDQWFEARGIEA